MVAAPAPAEDAAATAPPPPEGTDESFVEPSWISCFVSCERKGVHEREITALISLPSSSEKSFSNLSSSASIPAVFKSFLTSFWVGDPPLRESKRYAARCFI